MRWVTFRWLVTIAEAISRRAKVNLRNASEELVVRTKIAEKFKKATGKSSKRVEQKIRRVENAQAAVDKAETTVQALESFTATQEVFGSGIKELANPLIVEATAEKVDNIVSEVEATTTFSGDRNTVTVERDGGSRTYFRSEDSGSYELKQ